MKSDCGTKLVRFATCKKNGNKAIKTIEKIIKITPYNLSGIARKIA